MTSKSTFGPIGLLGRLFLGFSLLTIPIIIGTILFLHNINVIDKNTENMSHVLVPTRTITANLNSQLFKSQLLTYNWLLTGNEASKNELMQLWEQIKKTKEQINKFEPKWENKNISPSWKALQQKLDPVQASQIKIISMQPLNIPADIKQELIKNLPLINQMNSLLDTSKNSEGEEQGMFNLLGSEMKQQAQFIRDEIDDLQNAIYYMLLFIILLSLLVSWITARKIVVPIRAYSKHSAKIAAGDLTHQLTINRSDELMLRTAPCSLNKKH
ncbi:MAG: methyl-accepting chemotaxis protein [Legionella sp.]|nr:methyl-accepting chemotaxis protein [Legionella sp.]